MAGYHQARQVPMESYSTQSQATTSVSSSSTDDRRSQALRASVLDVALQLGLGTSKGIDKWLDGGDSADDPGTMSSPTLTYDKSATSASEESWTPDSQHTVPSFSHTNKSQWSPYTPRTPYTDFSAPNTLAVDTHPDESQLRSYSRQGDITFVDPDTLPRPDTSNRAPKKLKKKRGDGFESDGYVSDSIGFVKRKDKDATGELDKKRSDELEKKRLKEEKRDAKARVKEEKKRAKKDKDAAGPSTFLIGGYETDNASYGYLSSNEPVKKSKPKKKSKGDGDKARGNATTDVEDGYQSAPAAVKKRPTFLKLRSGRSKSDLQKETAAAASRSPSPPPVPTIHPLPIASRFATTFVGGSRSETPIGSITSSSMDAASVSTAIPSPSMGASSNSGSVGAEDNMFSTPSRGKSRNNNNTVRFMGELVPADSITAEDFALFARAASPPPNLARPAASLSSGMTSRAQSPPVLRIPAAAVQPIYQTSNSAGAGPSRSAPALSGSEQTRSAGAMSPYSSSHRDPPPPTSPARALSPAALSLPQSRGPSPFPTGLVAPETHHGGRSPSPNPYLLPTSPSPRPSSPGQLSQLIVPSYDYVVPSPTRLSTVSLRADMPPPSPAPGSPLPRTPQGGWDDDEEGSTSSGRASAAYGPGRPVSPFGAGPRGRASPFPTRPVAQVPSSKSLNNGRPDASQLPLRASSRQGARSPAPSSIARYHQLGQPRGQSDDFDSQPQRQRADHSVSPSIATTSEQGHSQASLMKKPSGRRRSDSDVALNRFTVASAAPPINVEEPSDGEDGDDGADFESLFDRYAYDEKSAYGGMEDDEDEHDDRAGASEPAVRARGSLDLAEGIRRLSAMPPTRSQSPSSRPTPSPISTSSSSPTPVYPAPGSTTPVSTLSRKNTLTRAKPPPAHVPSTDSMLLDGDEEDDDDKSIYPDDGRRTMYEEEQSPPRRPSVEKPGSDDVAEMPRASFIDRDKSQRLRRALVDRVEMQYAYEKLAAKENGGELKSKPIPASSSSYSSPARVEPVKRQPSTRSQPSPTPSGLSARAVRSPPPMQRNPVSSRPRVQEAVKPGWF